MGKRRVIRIDPNELDVLLKEMDRLKRTFLNCRSYFPHMTEEVIGKQILKTGDYYVQVGFPIYLHFDSPLTKENIQRFNEIGTWINQNFIVRLHSLLEGKLGKASLKQIDKSTAGNDEMEILTELRNVFAHTSGKYDPTKRHHQELHRKLISHFRLTDYNPREFPIPIDGVCIPLFEGCRKYVQAEYVGNKGSFSTKRNTA